MQTVLARVKRRLRNGATNNDESDEQFIRRVYAELLGREPDAGGLQAYLAALSRGMRREDLALTAARSEEYLVRSASPAFPVRVVSHRYGDATLTVCIADELGRLWYDLDWPDSPELEFLARHRLQPGATVFDLGAHQGVVALAVNRFVQPGGRVIAVEANPFNAGLVDVNRRLNNADAVAVVSAAVAERSGELRFGRGGNGQISESGGGGRTVVVPAYTVDDLAEEKSAPDVVILDVEGYEARVLAGAPQTLQRPVDWYVEVHSGCGLQGFGGSVDEVLSYFPSDRFDRFLSNEEDRQPRPFNDEQFERIQGERFYLTAIAR